MILDVTDIFEEIFGEPRKHNESSFQISFDCPLCDDDKHSGNLELNYQYSVFKCWSCCEINNMQGKIPYLLKRFGKRDSLKNYLLLKPAVDEVNEHKVIVVKLPKEFRKFHQTTKKDYSEILALKYLYDRGITDYIIKKYNIGFASSGDYFNRIIIPSYGKDGKLNYFVARWFSKEKTKIKYLNPDAEKEIMIFNERKINYDATIYIVEGVFDHIVIPNSVPLLGKFISPFFLDELHQKATGIIVIVLDGEEAAYKDAVRLYKELNVCDLRGRIRIVRPSDDEDPSSLFQKYGAHGVIEVLRGARQLTYEELE